MSKAKPDLNDGYIDERGDMIWGRGSGIITRFIEDASGKRVPVEPDQTAPEEK